MHFKWLVELLLLTLKNTDGHDKLKTKLDTLVVDVNIVNDKLNSILPLLTHVDIKRGKR